MLSIAVQAHLKWQLLPGDRPQGRGAVSCFLICSFEACGLYGLVFRDSFVCGFNCRS